MQHFTDVLTEFHSYQGASMDYDPDGDLFTSVYPELKRMAARQMRAERKCHTMQATALVHEAFLRIARSNDDCKQRLHFFALASKAMRHILVDHARARSARKRDGGAGIELAQERLGSVVDSARLLDIHGALNRLAAVDARQALIVEMRFFGGCTEEEIALVLGVSARTVKREWALARVWLYGELSQ